MAALTVSSPYKLFTDVDGNPLESGYIYIGTAGLNAEASPISAYWDAALTIPAAQPIRTIGGSASQSGSPANIYVDAGDYSIIVKNKNMTLVYSALNATERTSAALVTYNQGDTGAVDRTVEERLRDGVSVKDFGATGDGVTNDSPAFQAAADSAGAKARFFIPPGDYNLADAITYDPIAKNIIWDQDTDVTFTNITNLYAPGVQPNVLAVQNSQLCTTHTSGDDTTSAGLYISYFQKGATLTGAYEKDAIHALAKTSDEVAPGVEQGVVGVRGTGVISSTNTDGQAWAMNAYGQIDLGGDGLLHGLEVNLAHFGSDNPVPDTVLAKYGINITTKAGTVAGTAAIKIGSGSNWHYGIYATQSSLDSAASKFINLKDLFTVDGQGRISVGVDAPTEQVDIRKGSGRSQVAISSDGAGGEASTRYTDTGTRNWASGHWFDTGRYTISAAATLSSGRVFEIDANGSFGINGFDSGSGQGGVFIANAAVAPTANPTGGGILYVEGGALKFRGSAGTVTTIAPA